MSVEVTFEITNSLVNTTRNKGCGYNTSEREYFMDSKRFDVSIHVINDDEDIPSLGLFYVF